MTTAQRLKPKPRQLVISMPYPGEVISVNHYRGRNRYGSEFVRGEAQAWMDALGWQLKLHHIEDWQLPLNVTCSGIFSDLNHAPDLSNLSKCTLDAIEAVTGVNDRDMRWHDGDMKIDPDYTPEMEITIEEAE